MTVMTRLSLRNFRNYERLDLELLPGRTVVQGRNGQGKSNLIEAIGYLGSLGSFRGAPNDALIARDAEAAVVRAMVTTGDRDILLEAEIARGRSNRILVNKQKLGRARELLGMMPVTVFGPDDLELIKDGPALRRRYLDELLVQLHPRNERVRADLDRILKQRNTLLRQAKGRLSDEIESTLAVWNAKLAETGTAWGDLRAELATQLDPLVRSAYRTLAETDVAVALVYDPQWRHDGLAAALDQVRDDEVRRGVTLVGPHRDDLEVHLDDMPSRTHASQGEQRTLALALRIAGHQVLEQSCGTPPILLLDDVFSELDDGRASALLELLVAEQTIITTATAVPAATGPVTVIEIDEGAVANEPIVSVDS